MKCKLKLGTAAMTEDSCGMRRKSFLVFFKNHWQFSFCQFLSVTRRRRTVRAFLVCSSQVHRPQLLCISVSLNSEHEHSRDPSLWTPAMIVLAGRCLYSISFITASLGLCLFGGSAVLDFFFFSYCVGLCSLVNCCRLPFGLSTWLSSPHNQSLQT